LNIFVLDEDPKKCAKYHCNEHVVEMITECAQLLSTAHEVLDGTRVAYEATHINHPCSKWVRESSGNYIWLYDLYQELSDEYTYRYEKKHKSWWEYRFELSQLPRNIPIGPKTKRPQCMPEEVKEDDAVDAYREYYRISKSHIANWKRREVPYWYGTV